MGNPFDTLRARLAKRVAVTAAVVGACGGETGNSGEGSTVTSAGGSNQSAATGGQGGASAGGAPSSGGTVSGDPRPGRAGSSVGGTLSAGGTGGAPGTGGTTLSGGQPGDGGLQATGGTSGTGGATVFDAGALPPLPNPDSGAMQCTQIDYPPDVYPLAGPCCPEVACFTPEPSQPCPPGDYSLSSALFPDRFFGSGECLCGIEGPYQGNAEHACCYVASIQWCTGRTLWVGGAPLVAGLVGERWV